MIIFNDLKFLIPETFLLFSILFLLCFGIFYSNKFYYKYVKLNEPIITLLVIVCAIYILLIWNNISFEYSISNFLFLNDNLISFLKIYFSICMIAFFLVSRTYLKVKQIYEFEILILFMLVFLGILFVIMSYDFITIFISLELQTLCFYILIATSKINKTLEASIKYYILGSFSTALLILGISFIYLATGMTNLKDLSDYFLIFDDFQSLGLIKIGLILVCCAFFFKLSLAPFHFWLIDVFDGSLRLILVIFANLSKLSILILFYKLYLSCFIKVSVDWINFFSLIILLSWFFGSVGGLTAKKLNRLLAYSSVTHMGFFLFAVLLNNFYGLFIYFIFYSFNLFFLFVSLMSIIQEPTLKEVYNLSQVLYFKKINYILTIALTVSLLSVAGIPPLAGFFGKFFIILWSINHSMYYLALIALLISIISCFYYLRVTKLLNFDNNKKWIFIKVLAPINCYVLLFFLIFNIFFVIFLPFLTVFAEFLYYTSFF